MELDAVVTLEPVDIRLESRASWYVCEYVLGSGNHHPHSFVCATPGERDKRIRQNRISWSRAVAYTLITMAQNVDIDEVEDYVNSNPRLTV